MLLQLNIPIDTQLCYEYVDTMCIYLSLKCVNIVNTSSIISADTNYWFEKC